MMIMTMVEVVMMIVTTTTTDALLGESLVCILLRQLTVNVNCPESDLLNFPTHSLSP
jgi:hypothetical protein